MIVKQRVSLFAVYCILGVVFAFVARGGSLAPAGVAAFLASLWLGFVLAISFMEAWIKFQAPFVPRHFALDIGRTVFSALQAVELAFAVSLLVLHAVTSLDDSVDSGFGLLIVLVVLLVLEVVVVTPKLLRRADHAICDQLSLIPEESLTAQQRTLRVAMQNTVRNNAPPSPYFHGVYVLAELIKIVLLMVYIIHYLRKL